MHIENIVVGSPIVEPSIMLAYDSDDWNHCEEPKTHFTEERFLPRILVNIGVAPSINEVKRNKPELVKSLDELDFIKIKWGKKRFWILVGN